MTRTSCSDLFVLLQKLSGGSSTTRSIQRLFGVKFSTPSAYFDKELDRALPQLFIEPRQFGTSLLRLDKTIILPFFICVQAN